MNDFGIQVSIKTPNDTLINVRGVDPTDFDVNLSHALEKAEEIQAAEAAFKKLAPRSGPDGVALLQEKLGAVVVGEYDEPQAPPIAGAYAPTHCDRCKESPACSTCGRACILTPKSVRNGQWYVHDCPSGDKSHKGKWCNEPK